MLKLNQYYSITAKKNPFKKEEIRSFRHNQFEEKTHIRLDEKIKKNLYAFQICQMS
jgi:hypothetical protein